MNYFSRIKSVVLLIAIMLISSHLLFAQNEIKIQTIKCYNLGDGRYYCQDKETEKPLQGSSRIIDGYTSQYTEVVFKDGIPNGSWKLYQYNKLIEEYSYKEGILDGSNKEYYSDGTIKATRNYVNGKPEGKFLKYGPKGNVESEVNFKNGVQDGDEIFYDSEGKVRSTTKYNEGKETGKKVQTFSDYTLTANYNDGVYDGEYSEIYLNGNTKVKGQYTKGKKTGTWEYGKKEGRKIRTDVYSNDDKIKETIYYTDETVEVVRELKGGKRHGWERKYTYGDGSLKSELFYADGEISSSSTTGWSASSGKSGAVKQTKQISSNIGNYIQSFYLVNGKYDGEYTEQWVDNTKGMKTKGQYENGKKTGHWVYENSYGKRQKEENYLNDKLEGKCITYSDMSKPSEIFEYKNGEKNGAFTLYRYNSEILRESGTYVNGKIQGLRKYYYENGKLYKEEDIPADPYAPTPFKEYWENGKLRYIGVTDLAKGLQYLEEYDETGKKVK